MGNNNSTQIISEDDDKMDFLGDINDSKNTNTYIGSDITSDTNMDTLIVNGMVLPYESVYGSDTNSEQNPKLLISEDIKYIEFVQCDGNYNYRNERYAVNKKPPNHKCVANCNCIAEIYKIDNENELQKIFMEVPCENSPNMKGGANSATSSDNLSDLNRKYSTTSDINDEDIFENKTNKNGKKGKINLPIDDLDEDDEELEGLELDDEDITETGIAVSPDNINSSDIHKMQSRMFQSETDSDIIYDDSDDGEYTEKVRKAISRMENRNNIFDSEDQKILDMNSTTDKYMSRPINHNEKYV